VKRGDGVHLWVEDLGAGRGQLHRDVVIDGELVTPLCEPLGSPAPIQTVERFVERVRAGGAP
jgi:hypothetical protein